VACSTTGWLGNGMTQAKLVPEPVKRVSITRRSAPLVKWMSARWSGMVTLAGMAVGGNTFPSASAPTGSSSNSNDATILCALEEKLTRTTRRVK